MNIPKINVDVSAGQIIKISLVNVLDDDKYQRDLWLELKSNEDSVISIDGLDLEIMTLWERSNDELSEAKER